MSCAARRRCPGGGARPSRFPGSRSRSQSGYARDRRHVCNVRAVSVTRRDSRNLPATRFARRLFAGHRRHHQRPAPRRGRRQFQHVRPLPGLTRRRHVRSGEVGDPDLYDAAGALASRRADAALADAGRHQRHRQRDHLEPGRRGRHTGGRTLWAGSSSPAISGRPDRRA